MNTRISIIIKLKYKTWLLVHVYNYNSFIGLHIHQYMCR